MAEKKQMGSKLEELTKDNENLKVKFSTLLDQFQEYVNEQERKNEEDQHLHKSEQEKLLGDLNSTIKELEEMSKALQQDVHEKQMRIEELENELSRMERQLREEEDEARALKSSEDMNKIQIKSLNEEIKYMKQQYLLEIEALRGENVNLHSKARDRSSEAQNNRKYQQHRSQSPYDMNEDVGSQHMQHKYEDSIIEHNHLGDIKLNRNKSQLQMAQNFSNGMRRSRENRWKENDQELQEVVCEAKEYRSKSQDKI